MKTVNKLMLHQYLLEMTENYNLMGIYVQI